MRSCGFRIRHIAPGFAAALVVAALFASRSAAQVSPVLPAGFSNEILAANLDRPIGLAFLKDGRFLVIEQVTARILLVVHDRVVSEPLATVAGVDLTDGERGLVGITVDPAWPDRPYVYVLFASEPGVAITIARFTASGDLTDRHGTNLTLSSRLDLLTDLPDTIPIHNGGTLRFGPDGRLYASLGDDSDPCAAQDSTGLRGAILRLDVSWIPNDVTGTISKHDLRPPDNPFPGTNENLGLVYCYGLRNPFRMQIDPETGIVYAGDVGQGHWEEINEAQGGENFGWPFREGPDVRTLPGCVEPGGRGTGSYDPPIFAYDRSGFTASITCAGVYRRTVPGIHSFPRDYEGSLFYADFYQGFIRRLVKSGDAWVPAPPVPGQPSGADWAINYRGVADWQPGPDGALYYVRLLTGELGRITYRRPDTPAPPPPPPEQAADGSAGGPLPVGPETPVRLSVFDVMGRSVTRLADQPMTTGAVDIPWDGRDASGRRVPPGVYFVRIETPRGTSAARLVVTRR